MIRAVDDQRIVQDTLALERLHGPTEHVVYPRAIRPVAQGHLTPLFVRGLAPEVDVHLASIDAQRVGRTILFPGRLFGVFNVTNIVLVLVSGRHIVPGVRFEK